MSDTPRERIVWLDTAKGISIALVVLLHAMSVATVHAWPLDMANKWLVLLRMPLFFFISGVFAQGLLRRPWKQLLATRVATLLWVFVVWSVITFLTVELVRQIRAGESLDFSTLLRIFIEPPATLWFIYALAIITIMTRLLMQTPTWFALSLLGGMYWWSAASGDWSVSIPVVDRMMRLALFFYLGAHLSTSVLKWIPRWTRAWPLFVVLYSVAAATCFKLRLLDQPWATFSGSILGLIAALTFSCSIGQQWAGLQLATLGRNSLYIYVMHRIVLAQGMLLFAAFHLPVGLLGTLILWTTAITAPIFAAAALKRAGGSFLFALPFRSYQSFGHRPPPPTERTAEHPTQATSIPTTTQPSPLSATVVSTSESGQIATRSGV